MVPHSRLITLARESAPGPLLRAYWQFGMQSLGGLHVRMFASFTIAATSESALRPGPQARIRVGCCRRVQQTEKWFGQIGRGLGSS